MERTQSIGRIASRFSGHKTDDGHLAADHTSENLSPLIRIVDAAVQETLPGQAAPVLYLKHDARDKPFLTTHADTPREPSGERNAARYRGQHLDASMLSMRRAAHWMNQRSRDAKVQEAASALMDLSTRNDTTDRGLACTPVLRQALLDLHNALQGITPSTNEPPETTQDSPTKRNRFKELRRSLTGQRRESAPGSTTGSRENSRSRSPVKKQPVGLPLSSQKVRFWDQETQFVPASPHKPPSQQTTPRTPHSQQTTPRLGAERESKGASPRDVHPTTDAGPPGHSLPPVSPATATDAATTSPTISSARGAPLRLSAFESHRRHPQPSLHPQVPGPQPGSTPGTPARTPRDPDKSQQPPDTEEH